MTTKIINGSDIMLFVEVEKEGTKKFIPTVAAKSHKLSYKASTKTRVTKDTENSMYEEKSVKTISVSISVDGLVALDSEKADSADILQMMKRGQAVKAKYGVKNESAADSYEEGMFIIESWDQSSPAAEDASYSATLINTGEVKTVKVDPEATSQSKKSKSQTNGDTSPGAGGL